MNRIQSEFPQLICTDLDGTLLPNGSAIEPPGVRERFARIVARPEVTLAYVTGRHLASVGEAIEEFEVPWPDFAICDVGSSIYQSDGPGVWRPLRSWDERMRSGWPEDSRAKIVAALAGQRDLRAQEGPRQTPFKSSYYIDALPQDEALPARIEEQLSRAGLRATVIYSIDHESGVGLLDLLPPGSGKLAAIEHLLEHGDFLRDRTMFAGDSGNDLEALSSSIPAVLVANASDAIRQRAMEAAVRSGLSERLLLASAGAGAEAGNYAGGILAGLLHFWPGVEEWIT